MNKEVSILALPFLKVILPQRLFTKESLLKYIETQLTSAEHELILLKKAGEIKDLELQPIFILQDGFVYNGKKYREIKYIADFAYAEINSNKWIVEEVKGWVTKEYAIKKKLLLYKYPRINFVEIK